MRTILFFLGLLGSVAARADCSTQSAAVRPHLIELFSSEGCSSCPPAENWLRGLRDSNDVVALEFHVDYWDNLGWRDRFADARYTQRQQAAATHSHSGVFTPQVFLDGHNWGDWYRANNWPSVAPGSIELHVSAGVGKTLGVQITTAANPANKFADYRNYVALVEDGLSTQVHAGENRGVQLKHDHVVRAFAGPLPLAAARTELPMPRDADASHMRLVAFTQNPHDGDVAQVTTLALGQCAAP
jgi:hypothetical protein